MLQKDLLLPWRTVLDNVAVGMEIRGVSLAEAWLRARPYFARLGHGGGGGDSGGIAEKAVPYDDIIDLSFGERLKKA